MTSAGGELYARIDRSGFYRGTATRIAVADERHSGSQPNPRRVSSKESTSAGLDGLKGTRRRLHAGSIYNAFPRWDRRAGGLHSRFDLSTDMAVGPLGLLPVGDEGRRGTEASTIPTDRPDRLPTRTTRPIVRPRRGSAAAAAPAPAISGTSTHRHERRFSAPRSASTVIQCSPPPAHRRESIHATPRGNAAMRDRRWARTLASSSLTACSDRWAKRSNAAASGSSPSGSVPAGAPFHSKRGYARLRRESKRNEQVSRIIALVSVRASK